MNKKMIIGIVGVVVLLVSSFTFLHFHKDKETVKTNKLTATVLSKSKSKLTIQDSKNGIYTFSVKDMDVDIGSNVVIEYTGLLDKSTQMQTASIINCSTIPVSVDEDGIPYYLGDDDIFSQYYILAMDKLKTLSLDEKIGQLLLVRYPGSNGVEEVKKYNFAGYVFYEKDFKDKSVDEVKSMMANLQKAAKIPLLTAVDEEGGKVVRVSSNPNLASSKFKSSRELYQTGGFNLIRQDTKDKSKLLNNLGLNLNLAPVVDVSTDSNDYMYERALGEGTELTSTYAKTVVEASKDTGVSYVLKHFPGYGNNADTHYNGTTDDRTYESLVKNDLPPFEAGIDVGAEAILVSHNIVSSIDSNNPASLSPSVHNLLRNNLNFSGIIMTDDLGMGAVSSIDNAVVKAILAGNDLIMVTDYQESFDQIKKAVKDGTISEEQIDKISSRILAWKYYKGIMFEVHK